MNEQDVNKLIADIIGAVKLVLGDKWKEAQVFAESEAKKFALNIAEIVLWKETGKITEEQAKVLIRMHERSMKMVLTAMEGISLVLAEKAINTVIDTIAKTVNTLIRWELF